MSGGCYGAMASRIHSTDPTRSDLAGVASGVDAMSRGEGKPAVTIIQAHDDSEEIIRASQLIAPIDGFPETAIASYSRVKFEHLLKTYPCELIATLNTACAPIHI